MTWPPSMDEIFARKRVQRDCEHDYKFTGYSRLGTGTFREYACACGRTFSERLGDFDMTFGDVPQKRIIHG